KVGQLKPEPGPDRARFDRGDEFIGEARESPDISHLASDALDTDALDTLGSSPEPPTLGRDQGCADVLSETFAQHRAQIADAISRSIRHGLRAHPILSREQGFFRARELVAAARLDERDEALVNLRLNGLEPINVLRVFWQERIERRFIFAGGVDAPFDSE